MKKEEVEKIEEILESYLLHNGFTALEISNIAKTFTDAGYVHKSQITIDEGEAYKVMSNLTKKGHWFKTDDWIKELAQALKKADIIKIEEE